MKRRLFHFFLWASGFRRLPKFLQNLFDGLALRLLDPIGGASPINGADVLLRLNDSSGIIDIAYQKDCSFDTSNALIDISNKTSGRRSLYLMGRLDEEISLDMFWSSETSYILLRNAARNGLTVVMVRAWDDDQDGVFENIEQANVVITKLGEKFPDQEGAMVNVSFKVSGNWGAVV